MKVKYVEMNKQYGTTELAETIERYNAAKRDMQMARVKLSDLAETLLKVPIALGIKSGLIKFTFPVDPGFIKYIKNSH